MAAQVRRDDVIAGSGDLLRNARLEEIEVCVSSEAVQQDNQRAGAHFLVGDGRAVEGLVGVHGGGLLGAGRDDGEEGQSEGQRGEADQVSLPWGVSFACT